MPEQYTVHVKAREVRPGDVVIRREHQPARRRVVEKVDVKNKFTYITTENSTAPERVQHSVEYTVERTRPTAEEQHAQRMREALESVDRAELDDREELRKARKSITETIADGRKINGHQVSRLMKAQAAVALWDRVTHISHRRADSVWTMQLAIAEHPEQEAELLEAIEADMRTHVPTRLSIVRWVMEHTTSKLLENIDLDNMGAPNSFAMEKTYELQGSLEWCRQWRWSSFAMLLEDPDVERFIPMLPVLPNPRSAGY